MNKWLLFADIIMLILLTNHYQPISPINRLAGTLRSLEKKTLNNSNSSCVVSPSTIYLYNQVGHKIMYISVNLIGRFL